ncbi:MAG: RNA polymerase sigma factor [Mangrovibacterium sp.]
MADGTLHNVDKALIDEFALGDMRAFDIIYEIFNAKLQKFVFTLVKTEAETEEIVQDVFVKIWENRGKLKNHTSFESYLFSIAYHTTISLLRNKVKETRYVEYVKSVQIEIEEPENEANITAEEINKTLNLLIEKMPPRQREVFKMKHFENFTYREVAEKLHISINTVENHLVKAHKFLKKNLGRNYLAVFLFIQLFY